MSAQNAILVDSHCHLNFPDFKEDLEGVIVRAKGAGVTTMQTICTEMAEFEEVHAIATANDGIFCSVGVHPNNVKNAEIVLPWNRPSLNQKLLPFTPFTVVLATGSSKPRL